MQVRTAGGTCEGERERDAPGQGIRCRRTPKEKEPRLGDAHNDDLLERKDKGIQQQKSAHGCRKD